MPDVSAGVVRADACHLNGLRQLCSTGRRIVAGSTPLFAKP